MVLNKLNIQKLVSQQTRGRYTFQPLWVSDLIQYNTCNIYGCVLQFTFSPTHLKASGLRSFLSKNSEFFVLCSFSRLVEKVENMQNNAIGDGRETCLLCNSKFGALKVIAKRCDICGMVGIPVICCGQFYTG